MNIFFITITFLVGYLLGSINSSIIICKIMTGKDIREFGSGNAGATNALRTLGKKAGTLVFVFDALKTVAALCIVQLIFNDNRALAVYFAGIGAVIGHNYPVWFGFKGGKGIVVSIVTVFFTDYKIGIVVFIVALLVMIITKYVSLGSIVGSVLLLLLSVIFKRSDPSYLVYAFIISVLAIYRHKVNIIRLIGGTESKIRLSSKK